MMKATPSPPVVFGPIWKRKKAWKAVVAVALSGVVRNAEPASFGTLLVVRRMTLCCASNAFPLKVKVVSAVGKLQ